MSKSNDRFILTSPRPTPPRDRRVLDSVYHDERLDCLLDAMEDCAGTLSLVFCNTKSDVKQVTRYLQDENIAALSMHGDLEQFERTERLIRFSNKVQRSW